MQAQQFAELARQSYNRIPISRRVLADCETPLSAYAKLGNCPYTFLFESVEGGEKWGRYSIIGLSATRWIRVQGDRVETYVDGQLESAEASDDPLQAIEQYRAQFRVPELPELPPFHGGLVGYFGYDTVRYVEPKLKGKARPDRLGHADILLMVCEELLVFDNLSGVVTLICHADPALPDAFSNAHDRLDHLSEALRAPAKPLPELSLDPPTIDEAEFRSSFGEEAFKNAVETVREYVLAGDAMQVVLSQRMSVPFADAPLSFYRALRHLNPSPYLYYLDLGEVQVAGSSPEILARLEDGEVKVRPIAGTRRRGHTDEEDKALEADLLADPKELAEHLMLIDLGRNDVGRVADIGTVDVTDTMVVERYSHVMHIVSNVKAQAREGVSAMDVLRATLPAGTLSGAPKVRAMEIIDELEPVKRGIYGGAIGYIGWHGNMDTAIAIRTAVISDGQLHIQAGAGVVADSQPRLEWKETMNKGRAIFRAVAMTYNDFDH